MGCGLGLLGMNCLNLCKPKQYVFTDSHEKVLSQLSTNIRYNYPDGGVDKIRVEKLNWNELDECNLLTGNQENDFDLILASGT